jgi:hypothetical protein
MKPNRWILGVVVTVAISASCGRLPQSTRTDEHTTSIRADYLRNHPNGPFNVHIAEGRVTRGMNIMEVLASWGAPNLRRTSPEGSTEYWAYYAKDEHTQKMVSYELVFENQVVTRWVIDAAVASTLGTTSIGPDAARTIQETLQLGSSPSATGDSPVKKKP